MTKPLARFEAAVTKVDLELNCWHENQGTLFAIERAEGTEAAVTALERFCEGEALKKVEWKDGEPGLIERYETLIWHFADQRPGRELQEMRIKSALFIEEIADSEAAIRYLEMLKNS